jgi:hypothetical protein
MKSCFVAAAAIGSEVAVALTCHQSCVPCSLAEMLCLQIHVLLFVTLLVSCGEILAARLGSSGCTASKTSSQ